LSWINRLIILTWQKLAPIVIIIYNFKLSIFFILIIIFCILTRGIQGLNQVRLRKILTYSSINHIGWILRSIIYLESIWFIYFIIYIITSINIVLILSKNNIFYLKQLFSNLNKNFFIKFIFILNFISLGGLPPLLGFFPKWLTIQELIFNKIYFLTLIIVIITLITLYFYIRIIFSTLILNINEINIKLNSNINFIFIFFINLLSIIGLIFCKIVFINL